MQIKVIHTGPFSVNSLIVPLCGNKVFVVDPAACDYSFDKNVICDYLTENELVPVAIILTHGHFDHVSGLPIMREKFPNIPILIHKDDSKAIGETSSLVQGQELSYMGFFIFLPYVSNLPSCSNFLDDEKNLLECFDENNFDEELKKSLSEWKIFHTPGHTKGSVCLFNEIQKILISGDTLFYHSWGRTDLFGGSEVEIQKSLRRLFETISDDVKIYPGHDRFGFTKKD